MKSDSEFSTGAKYGPKLPKLDKLGYFHGRYQNMGQRTLKIIPINLKKEQGATRWCHTGSGGM